MASQGPRSAGAGANQTGVGTVAWSNPGNIVASDNTWSIATPMSAGAVTNYLLASSFGFSIPAGSTIDGIVVEVERYGAESFGSDVRDSEIKIVKGGSIGSTNKGVDVAWPDADFKEAYASYGGSSDLWGETWTAEDVNASDFGLAISVRNPGVKWSVSAAVDHVRITVYYTEGASPPAAASATMGLMGVG